MPSSHEQARADFQRDLDALPNGASLPLSPREYPGPIVITRSLVLDGQGSTIWALNGPVISCRANGIILRNLRVEATGDVDAGRPEDRCALKVEHGCTPTLENVEVRGSVVGLEQEEGEWHYPYALQLGSLSFGSEHELIVRVYVPVKCSLDSSKVSGLNVQPYKLEPGPNEITLHIERIAKETLLNGNLYICTTHLKRSIAVNGYISSTPPRKSRSKKRAQVIWQPSDWETLVTMPRPTPSTPLSSPAPAPRPGPPSGVPLSPQEAEQIVSAPEEKEEILPTRPSPLISPTGDLVSEELTRPSGPSVKWPPKPAPVPGPTPHIHSPWPYRKLALIAGLVCILMIIGGALWMLWPGSTIDPETVKELRTLIGHNDEVESVAFSPDGKVLASGSKGGVIKLWNAKTGDLQQEQLPTKHDGAVRSLAFSHNGKLLASGSADVNVIIWDLQQIGQIKGKTPLRDEVNSVAFSPDDTTIVCGSNDGTVRFLDTQSGQPQSLRLPHGSPVKAVAFSPNGKIVASGGEDGSVKLWDAATGGMKLQLSPKHNGAVMALAFSYDGTILASGGSDKKLILWDVESGQMKSPSPFLHADQVSSLAFSPDDKIIVSAGAGRDSTVRLWDVQTGGAPKKLLVNHTAAVNSVAVSSGGKIASGSSDKTVKLWGSP